MQTSSMCLCQSVLVVCAQKPSLKSWITTCKLYCNVYDTVHTTNSDCTGMHHTEPFSFLRPSTNKRMEWYQAVVTLRQAHVLCSAPTTRNKPKERQFLQAQRQSEDSLPHPRDPQAKEGMPRLWGQVSYSATMPQGPGSLEHCLLPLHHPVCFCLPSGLPTKQNHLWRQHELSKGGPGSE